MADTRFGWGSHQIFYIHALYFRKSIGSKIGNFAGFQLKLKLVRDQGDKFGIGAFDLDFICRVCYIANEAASIVWTSSKTELPCISPIGFSVVAVVGGSAFLF